MTNHPVNITEVFGNYHALIDARDLDERDRKRLHKITDEVASRSFTGLLVWLMDSYSPSELKYVVGERRSGRVLAWRQGKGYPSQEQEARLRIWAWCVQVRHELDPEFSRYSMFAGVSQQDPFEDAVVPERYRYSPLDALLVSRRYDEIGARLIESL